MMKSKILKHYKEGFSSSPIDITNEQIECIIECNCICDDCGRSIFELDDFPEVSPENNELLCEDCYHYKYRQACPICENYYDIHDQPDYIVITEELSKETGQLAGIYKILEHPFFFGNILTGFDAFFENTIKLVARIDINKYKEIDCGRGYYEVYPDFICPDCESKFTTNKRYADIEGRPAIFFRGYENTTFADYTPEMLKNSRSKLVHQRITCRGLIEKSRV